MSKYLIYISASTAGFVLICAAIAFGSREVVHAGPLYLADNGGIFPSKLPKHEPAPVKARIDGEIGTVDGSHPPALRTISADIDRTIEINTVGLPTCRLRQIETRATAAARNACPGAIVGSGQAEVEVAFPEQRPFSAKGAVVLFNGGVHGDTTLVFIHAYVPVPAPTAIVATAKVTHINRGRFGLHFDAQIPKIAGGSGSTTGFDLLIGRRFSYKGKKESFLTASCPTGSYATQGKVLFSDGTKLGISHVFPCTARD